MKLSPRIGWGLAWAGLAVVVAVPSADFLAGRLAGDGRSAAVLTSDIDPVAAGPARTDATETASVTTTKTPNGVIITPAGSTAADPVDRLLEKGKPLPDYISDGDSKPEQDTQVAAVAAPPATPAVKPVAPPTPFPVWARPQSVAATPVAALPDASKVELPAPPAATLPAPDQALPPPPAASKPAAPVVTAPANEPLVIVDERATGSIREPTGPVPPAPIVDDRDNWDTESLRDYLERRGILDGGDDRSSARVTERSRNYDPDGFYMDEGPNADRETRRERIQRLFEESGDDPRGFTLF